MTGFERSEYRFMTEYYTQLICMNFKINTEPVTAFPVLTRCASLRPINFVWFERVQRALIVTKKRFAFYEPGSAEGDNG